jgi:hypothetical protein
MESGKIPAHPTKSAMAIPSFASFSDFGFPVGILLELRHTFGV